MGLDEKMEFEIELGNRLEDEIDQLKQAEREAEKYIYICKMRIKEYESKLKAAEERINMRRKSTEHHISMLISEAHRENKIGEKSIRDTKTMSVYTIPSAKLVFKKPCTRLINKDPDALLKYLEDNNKSEFIKTEKKVNWAEYKKCLQVTGDGEIILRDTGELVKIDGIEIEEEQGNFEIKYL